MSLRLVARSINSPSSRAKNPVAVGSLQPLGQMLGPGSSLKIDRGVWLD